MNGQPSGIRTTLQTLRPWRGRIGWVVASWLVVVGFGAFLGHRPNIPQLAALLVAVAVLAWYVLDHLGTTTVTHWPASDLYRSRARRGQDFRVTNLATRIEAAKTRREGREGLVQDLHQQLGTIIRERLHAKHGLVIEEEPDWSRGVMPPELWSFVTDPPDPNLWRSGRLDQILRRIEQW
jgi:hypothetical protein